MYFSSASIDSTSAINVWCDPNSFISDTLHSIDTGDSFIAGAETNSHFCLVNLFIL